MVGELCKVTPEPGSSFHPHRDHTPLELVEHIEDLLGEAHGFGSFLFDTSGQVIVTNGMAWLYTTTLSDGKWESWARPFDFETLKAGTARRVLTSAPEDRRGAVIHHVIQISEGFIVGFFSGGVGLRAAIANAPDADFKRDEGFAVDPEQGWETRGGEVGHWVLESNGAYVVIDENADVLEFWEGYDSYLPQTKSGSSGAMGELAWARIVVDKALRTVRIKQRHPGNPLPFLASDWSCARCGGNLNNDVRINGKHAFFYYFRECDALDVYIGLALSSDPLFFVDTKHYLIDRARGLEEVVEKFQVIQQDNELLVFSENRFRDGSWRTGLRRFLVVG